MISRVYPLLLLWLVIPFSGFAQADGCDGSRYIDNLTTNLTVTTVEFGSNVNSVGDTQVLVMDVYEPSVDSVTQRPVIIFAFGGGFVSGNRQSMDLFCRTFAQKGYVTATIDYRIWNQGQLGAPDSIELMTTAFGAVSDMKAAIRHLKLDAQTDNFFKVDPDRIFVGGVSAGAVTALHAAYVTDDDALPPFIQLVLDAAGGLMGNSGDSLNQTMNDDVIGVINLSGGIYDTAWIAQGDLPVISYHGTDDEVVPFGFGLGAETVSIMGSGLIHQRMENLGNRHYLRIAEGAGHITAYLPPYFDDFLSFVDTGTNVLQDVLCEVVAHTRDPIAQIQVKLYPNPASSAVVVQASQPIEQALIYDQTGRLVQYHKPDNQEVDLDISGLENGAYFLVIQTQAGQTTEKLIVLTE